MVVYIPDFVHVDYILEGILLSDARLVRLDESSWLSCSKTM